MSISPLTSLAEPSIAEYEHLLVSEGFPLRLTATYERLSAFTQGHLKGDNRTELY